MKATLLSCAAAVVSASVPSVKIFPGIDMPMLAFGSWKPSFDNCTVQDGVEQWLSLGGRHLDTADGYGTQPDVGRALKASGVRRKDVFITTKIPGPIGGQVAYDRIANTALSQLGVDYIDLVLIHWPCVNYTKTPPWPTGCGLKDKAERIDTYKGLLRLRKEGKIRAVGVSNYLAEHVDEIKAEFKEVPATNQVRFHLAQHDEPLLAHMKEVGTVLQAWSPLGGPSDHGVSLGDARLKKVAAKYNVSTAQVELRWESQKGVAPVTVSCSRAHAMGDLESFSFTLTDNDIKYLDGLTTEREVLV